jgi:hypothetical protein
MASLRKQEYFEKNKDKIKKTKKKENTEKLRKPKISQFEIFFPYFYPIFIFFNVIMPLLL